MLLTNTYMQKVEPKKTFDYEGIMLDFKLDMLILFISYKRLIYV